MTNRFKFLAAAVAALSFQAQAAVITLSVANIGDAFDASDLATSFDAVSDSASVQNVTDFGLRSTGKEKINKLSIQLDMDSANTFEFDAGLDATYGAEWYVNGTLVSKSSNDLWWSRNWNNAAVFSINDITLTRGLNLVELYWAEGCCNGGNSVRFSALNANNADLNITNLEISEVPEPAPLALLGLSLAALVLRRRA